MKLIIRKYQQDVFIKIRDFLVKTYGMFGKPYNWTIDYWNFCRSFTLTMHEATKKWEETIGIWEDENQNIIGVVHSEGEGNGEVFFQLGQRNLPDHLIEEFFEYAEQYLSKEEDGKKILETTIPDRDLQREAIAIKRGYKKVWTNVNLKRDVKGKREILLPDGFKIKDGSQVSYERKAMGHAKAFNYYNPEDLKYYNKGINAYELMGKMPDYKAELDLYVVNEADEVAAFCTLWYDAVNKVGFLEPVGTVPSFRKKGLGRAVIDEAINRMGELGGTRVYVGPMQDFYLSIGFTPDYIDNIWRKEF